MPQGNEPLARAGRADALLADLASEGRSNRRKGAAAIGIQGVIYGGLGVVAITSRGESSDPSETAAVGGIALGIGAIASVISIYTFASSSDEEIVYENFRSRAAVDSAPAVAAAARELAELAAKREGQRRTLRAVGVILVAGGIGGIVAGKLTDHDAYLYFGITGVVLGSLVTLASLVDLPAEETWSKWQVELGAATTATDSRVPALGLRGRF